MKNIQAVSDKNLLLRWSLREIWQGQLWPVLAALVLITACVVALSALAIRVEKLMTVQGRSMLAADLVLQSANPIPKQLLAQSDRLGVSSSIQTRFQTMAFSEAEMQLVSVKTVQSNYPLRGELRLQGEGGQVRTSIQAGELWLDERLYSLLNVKIGDLLAIGDAELKVSGKIEVQPELSFNPFNTMPNIFIHQADLSKTGALQLGSRVQYRAFFKGDDKALQQLQGDHQLHPSQKWLSENRQGRTADLIAKAKQYLSLTILMVILMASVTLVLTCQHYAAGRADTVAMLKSMGASRRWLKKWLFGQVALLFITALFIGSLLGLGLELLLRLPLAEILPEQLPSYGWQPFIFAALVALLIGLPAMGIPLIRLLDTSAIAVLQSQAVSTTKKGLWLLLLPASAFLYFYGDNSLVWMVLAGLILLFMVLAVCSYGALSLLAQRKWHAPLMLALSRIKRSAKKSMMQLAALSGSLMLLAVIWLLRTDLLADWQQSLPPDAANVFALNIAPSEQLQYLQELDSNKVERSQAYPIIRGRLSQINGKDLSSALSKEEQKTPVLRREINFTWAEQLPSHNQVLAGHWGASKAVSIEQSVANDLGIKIGDKLTFSVNSLQIEATVNSLRQVHWQSLKPNFYFIFSPDLMDKLPATWLVSFRIEKIQTVLLNQLARSFPTVSLLDFRVMGGKIQIILQQISWSLTMLASLSVVSGVLLIFTLLRLSLKQRQREITLYRTLGASRKLIRKTLWYEYGLIAFAAGGIAAIAAESIVFNLIKQGFKLEPNLHITMWFVLPLVALFIVFISLSSAIKQLLKPLK